ncbi:RNA-binding RNA processing protein rpp1, partial [Teratosphaeriaceae sp. CCFEE 6253]
LACSSLDCDIISLDLTQRLPFYFKYKMLSEAIKSGKRFEMCYSQGMMGDSSARRNLISNATQLVRASRGKGLIISSEAKAAVGCRGPWDAINLATIWGLAQDRGFEAMSKEPRSVVVTAQLKRTSYRGIIDVVYGGEKPAPVE